MPNCFRYSSSLCLADACRRPGSCRCCSTWRARRSASGARSRGCTSSWNSRPPRQQAVRHGDRRSGVIAFSWIDRGDGHDLAGRAGLVDLGQRAVAAVRPPRRRGSVGSKVGAVASARIAPVRGSITTTVPLSASAALTSAASAFCAAHWMSRSIVSRTPSCRRPGRAAGLAARDLVPVRAGLVRSMPSVPARSELSASSRPPSPVPSRPTKPTTAAPSAAVGVDALASWPGRRCRAAAAPRPGPDLGRHLARDVRRTAWSR